jgi:diguanylate cyclase (GGDEF)-like protein
MVSQLRGLTYAFICVLLYSAFNIYFKVVSIFEINTLLFMATSMVFASFALLVKGGKTHHVFSAVKSPLSWLYSITFILECFFAIELLKYILATEMVLVSRISILLSFALAFIVLKRNNLGKGSYAIPLIVTGLAIVFYNIDNNFKEVLTLALLLSITKSTYYLSIELNKVGYKTKTYLEDFSVVGYILGITAMMTILILIVLTSISYIYNIDISFIPTYQDYANPKAFLLAAFYGVVGITILRYLEFKSIQSIKSEVFMCMVTLVPLITLVFESCAGFFGIIDSSVAITPTLLLANILIITGGLLVVILKVLGQELSDETDKQYLLKMIRSTEVFANYNTLKASRILEIKESKFKDILNNKNFTVLKSEFKHIQNCFNKKVAMSDHLTGLCNRLEFITELKHIDLNETASLFFIDLNKFKPVNDTHGHDAGDFILSSVARRLENIFADSTLTRLGGDEFALIVKSVTAKDSPNMVKQINEEIAKPYHYKGIEINISSSTGFANYPADTDSPVKLLEIADEQMYLMKKDSDR